MHIDISLKHLNTLNKIVTRLKLLATSFIMWVYYFLYSIGNNMYYSYVIPLIIEYSIVNGYTEKMNIRQMCSKIAYPKRLVIIIFRYKIVYIRKQIEE